jgi:glycosyltransferase involved in cell wall biosynthesis
MNALRATIVIAAHNEEQVLGRTLDALGPVIRSGEIEVLVVCNGCTDRTAEIARGFSGVGVAELDVASKVAALREGDRLAGSGTLIYLDADIVLTSRAAIDVAETLEAGALAARPPRRYDSHRAAWTVRRWYAVRQSLPSISATLWGAGCYALSEKGRSRFGEFPDLLSDDLFVHSLFSADEVVIVTTDPVVITTPRRTTDLLSILRRHYRTQHEVTPGAGQPGGRRSQLADLRSLLIRNPLRVVDVGVYVAVIAYARVLARASAGSDWERDTSSRQAHWQTDENRR